MNTIIPSVTETGAPLAKSKLRKIQCRMSDTQFIITNVMKTTSGILDEMVTLKGEVEEQTMVSDKLRIALRGQTTKVALLERERDAALVVVQDRERELERMREDAQDDRKKLEQETRASVTTVETEQLMLIVERGELQLEKAGLLHLLSEEKARLQRELASALATLQAGKTKCHITIANALLERKKVEEKMALVVIEKDGTTLALARERAQMLRTCDDMVKLESFIHDLQNNRRKLADELSVTQKEVADYKNRMELQRKELEQLKVHRGKLAEDLIVMRLKAIEKKRKMEEMHKTTLDQIQGDCKKVKHTLSVFETTQSLLEDKLVSMEKKKNEREIECETIRQELVEEKEKGLCEICFVSPRDTMCMPCLHFRYCSVCLDKHKQRSRTCPTCRTSLSGTLKSDISK